MSKKSHPESDPQYKQAIKLLKADIKSLSIMTTNLYSEAKELVPAISKVSKFKQEYDINHGELDVLEDVDKIVNKFGFTEIITSDMEHIAKTL